MEANVSRSLVLALLNVAANDGTGLAKTWTERGHPTPWADLAGFRTDVAALVPKVTSASLEELNFGVTLTAVLTHATRRGIQSSPVIALLGKSFADLEGSVRHLCPELSITDVFEENLRTIMFGLAQETREGTGPSREPGGRRHGFSLSASRTLCRWMTTSKDLARATSLGSAGNWVPRLSVGLAVFSQARARAGAWRTSR